ncbi:MAG: hypothetical protein HW413_2354, partial [Thermoleophilia bacterium]|nr:hypothetical protein [Thermoleophilia bacterium]
IEDLVGAGRELERSPKKYTHGGPLIGKQLEALSK